MQIPRQSFGDSITHPSTPCSASIECGGNRSIACGAGNPALTRARRGFFENSLPEPTVSVPSIIAALRIPERVRRDTEFDSHHTPANSHVIHKDLSYS